MLRHVSTEYPAPLSLGQLDPLTLTVSFVYSLVEKLALLKCLLGLELQVGDLKKIYESIYAVKMRVTTGWFQHQRKEKMITYSCYRIQNHLIIWARKALQGTLCKNNMYTI